MSAKLVLGLALALWSAMAATKARFDALNVIDDEEEKRAFFKLNAVALATTFGLAALETLIVWLRWPALLAASTAEFAAEPEHQTARDTTVGAARPMGARGANMADTVGAAQV